MPSKKPSSKPPQKRRTKMDETLKKQLAETEKVMTAKYAKLRTEKKQLADQLKAGKKEQEEANAASQLMTESVRAFCERMAAVVAEDDNA